MAVIHKTTLEPTKLELLAGWLPTRPWYRGGSGPDTTADSGADAASGSASVAPVLEKSGGFRLDDPEGEVGIEFMVVTDTSAPQAVVYLVPLTYRAEPLEGADDALIGTMEHGVLGKRWAYDGLRDPVLAAELLSLIEGRAPAMAQSVSDTPDHEVVRSYTGAPFSLPGFVPEPVDDQDGTNLPTPHGTTLHVHRVLQPVAGPAPLSGEAGPAAEDVVGHVARGWETSDGTRVGAVFVTLYS